MRPGGAAKPPIPAGAENNKGEYVLHVSQSMNENSQVTITITITTQMTFPISYMSSTVLRIFFC
jgi:hypothetical protein